MGLLFSNNAATMLAEAVAFDATEFVAEADGSANTFTVPQAAMPPGEQLATLTHPSYPNEYEVVRIVARAGETFTVERQVERIAPSETPGSMSQQGSAKNWPAGTKMEARITAGTLEELATPSAALIREGSIVMGVASEDYVTQAGSSESRSLVFEGRSRMQAVVQLSGFPLLQIENAAVRDHYNPAFQDRNVSYPSVGGSPPVDLGVPVAWAAGTDYPRGAVVVPATPDGNQYWLEIDELGVSGLTTSEPDWGTVDGITGGVEVSDIHDFSTGRWRAIPMPVDFTQEMWYGLVVTEVGFIAHMVTASTPPSVSIGTTAAPGRFASNVTLDQIAGHGCVHRIPIAVGGALVREIRYKVDAAATGGRFTGRFYWRGFFVETWEGL